MGAKNAVKIDPIKARNPRGAFRRLGPSVASTLGVPTPTWRRRKETPVEHQQQYVGIDLHRHRSVIVYRNGEGPQPATSEIARRAGDSSAAFTYDRYGHLFPEVDSAAAAKLDHLRTTGLAPVVKA